MPYRRFDWHERVKAVENEYKSVRIAVDQLKATIAHDPTVLKHDPMPENLNEIPKPLSIAEARARLQEFLSWMPEEWD
jgi:hypothetical protein